MYLARFTTRNIKCFEEAELRFPLASTQTLASTSAPTPSRADNYAGWHVILGANATGKTTLLQAIATSLIGPSPAMRLVSPSNWIRRGASHGTLEAEFRRTSGQDVAEGAPKEAYHASFAVVGAEPATIDGAEYTAPQVVLKGPKNKTYRGLMKGL